MQSATAISQELEPVKNGTALAVTNAELREQM
jgi:hypothetical protein